MTAGTPRLRPEAAPPAPAGGDGALALRGGLAGFIERRVGTAVAIHGLARLPGGTMRDAWAVDLEVGAGPLAGSHRLIYMPDRGGTPLGTRLARADEFRVLAAAWRAGVRVPRPYWDVPPDDPSGLAPGLILERVAGEALARRIVEDPAFEAVRPRLLAEIGEELARVHAVPVAGCPGATPGPSPAADQLAQLQGELDDLGEPHPALELGLRWLRTRAPSCDRPVVVHGDYRLGNILVAPESGLAAVLDWELCHVGDPGEDVGWVVIRFWRCVDHPGVRGLGPRERFLDAYRAAGGRAFDAAALHYWEVFANFRWAVITLRQAHRHLSGRQRSLELAAIGRHCAEVERELLRLLREASP